MAFIEGWPHLRGGLYEGFHCSLFRNSVNQDESEETRASSRLYVVTPLYRMETRTRGPHAYLFSVMAKYAGLQVLHSHSVRAMQ